MPGFVLPEMDFVDSDLHGLHDGTQKMCRIQLTLVSLRAGEFFWIVAVKDFRKRSASAFVRPVSAARALIRSAFVIVILSEKDLVGM